MTPARPLVLLHPYPADASFWNRFRDALGEERWILTPQAPGFGGMPARAGWSIDDLADQVAADIDIAIPGGRADVVGVSMGGYVALSLALRHPERCASLVLADTRADADEDAARHARYEAIAAISAGETSAYLDGLLPRLVGPDATDDVRAELDTCARRQPAGALVGALGALAERPDRSRSLGSIGMPTLVIVGADDAVTPPALAERLADGIPGARRAIVAGAGHLAPLERPSDVAGLVADHLRTTPA
jgi:pimeloyl-ACP methyl ester carboxylesterase